MSLNPQQLSENLIRLREADPLIHCITSPVAINDCANAVLAVGARPFMAEHPAEVEEVTAAAAALSVSLANLTDARIASVMIAGAKARELGKPSVIDAVGTAAITSRLELARRYAAECRPAVIKGNATEIRALAGAVCGASGASSGGSSGAGSGIVSGASDRRAGIDTAPEDQVRQADGDAARALGHILKELSRQTGAVVLASGAVDMLSDGTQVWAVENGSPAMARVTGTGCVLSCLIASMLAVADTPLEAALTAVTLWGIAGELAKEALEKGLGSYHVALIDALSRIDAEKFRELARVSRME